MRSRAADTSVSGSKGLRMNACAPASSARSCWSSADTASTRNAFAELLAQSQARAAADHEIDDRQVDALFATTRSASAIVRTTWTS